MKKLYCSLLSLMCTCLIIYGQNVAINNDGSLADSKAILDIKSNSKGILIPRMTAAELGAITGNVPLGLLIFQTDGERGFYYQASALPSFHNWKKITPSDEVYWQYASPGYLYTTNTASVGIGTSTPGAKLHVSNNAAEKLRLENTTALATAVSNELYFKTGSFFTGALKTIGTGSSFARMGLFTYASPNTSELLERLSIADDGNVGLQGNTTPSSPLSFASVTGNKISLWGSSQTSHFGLGVQGSLMQLYSSASNTDIAFGYGSSPVFTENMRIKGNGNVGIGTINPSAKLVITQNATAAGLEVNQNGTGTGGYFYSSGGNAIVAWSNAASQPAVHVQGTNAIAALGRVSVGNSDPSFPLDITGRVRLRNDGGSTPGIWFNKPDNTQGSFIGQYDANNFGIWGPGSSGSWKFLFDGNDGTLRIGTTQKAAGYLVNIGGKAIAEELRVQVRAAWPDYVFSKDYSLKPLEELENYIQQHNHLPGFQKAEVYEKEGADLGETQRKLLEKVEELTLYIIEANKRIAELEKKISNR